MLVTTASKRLVTSQIYSANLRTLKRHSSFSASEHGLSFQGATYPFSWLRDSCTCPACVHPSAHHKLHKTSDIPPNIKPKSDGIRLSENGLHIEWPNGHQSFFSIPFLDRHSSPSKVSAALNDVTQIPWDVAKLSREKDLFVRYESIQTPSGLLIAINQLLQSGLVIVKGVPNTEVSTQSCELRSLAQLFGDIRTTFHGEMFDVKHVRNSTNGAYTNLDVGLHMDLL